MNRNLVLSFVLMTLIGLRYNANAQVDTLAMWSFPTGNASDTLAEVYSPLNQNQYIYTTGGTSAIQFKNGATTKAAQVTDWLSGAAPKAWQIDINTSGFSNIKLSSKQSSGGSDPGPRDFQLEYRVGATGMWNTFGVMVVVANDWTTGVLDTISFPAACDNQPMISIRWLQYSDLDINGSALLASGKGKIDDILVEGRLSTGINDENNSQTLLVYPNPAQDVINIPIGNNSFKDLRVYNMQGQLVNDQVNILGSTNENFQLCITNLEIGLYFIQAGEQNQRFVKN